MIVPMTKYDIVAYHRDGDVFLERLQELGLVDVTTAGWEPDDAQVALLAEVEKRRVAVARLRGLEISKRDKPSDDPWQDYLDATEHLEDLEARIAAAEREAEQVRAWGDFDAEALHELVEAGVEMHFYVAAGEYNVAVGDGMPADARELPMPTATAAQKEAEIKGLEYDREQWEAVLRRAAAGVELIERQTDGLSGKLDLGRVSAAAARPAEGSLIVLEGWATRETAPRVDEFLDGAGVYYIKSSPTPEDDVPVALRNRKWSSPFEFIGNFYSLPRYGTLDLTAFFGPFYMVFFGFCLGDAGYGLMFVLGGFLLRRMANKKGRRRAGAAEQRDDSSPPGGDDGMYSPTHEPSPLKQVSNLTFLCGGAAMVFGFLAGGFFGVPLAELPSFARLREFFLTSDMLFVLALGLGLVQIVFALVLKIINTSQQFGFKYSLGTVGWLMVLCGLVYVALPAPAVHKMLTALTIKYPVHMPVFYTLVGVGVALMLFLNNPAKNPLVNFGTGLWNTYNDVTGLLGDLLSYIRLFALCLSGGTLALVFNELAGGLPIPIMIIVLLIGHGLNLFMSALGSFVHPMRLTFVEFYKNAGFEAAQREFKPLKRK